MKKVIALLIVTFAFAHADACQKRIEQLAALQQRLVTHTLKKLKPGAWARYKGGTAIFVGQKQDQNQTLYGIDVALKKVPAQGWFTLTPKRLETPHKTYRLPVLIPRTLYLRQGSGVLRFREDQIRSAALLFGIDLSALFSPLPSFADADCRQVPSLRTLTYRLGKRRLKAYRIEDAKGRYAILSEAVPFGIVELYDGKKRGVFLEAFGHKGGRPAITPAMRDAATELPFTLRISTR